jgi:hypothetical protein
MRSQAQGQGMKKHKIYLIAFLALLISNTAFSDEALINQANDILRSEYAIHKTSCEIQPSISSQNGWIEYYFCAHPCFDLIHIAKLEDLDFAKTSTQPNNNVDGSSWITIPCKGGEKCVTTEYGIVKLNRKMCKINENNVYEQITQIEMSSITNVRAQKIEEILKSKDNN